MKKPSLATLVAVILAACAVRAAGAQPTSQSRTQSPTASAKAPFALGPPTDDGPVVVRAGFQVLSLNQINDESETFEFSGVLTLRWQDKRQAFDPAAAGVHEKVYQGDYQFNELSPAWFPQVVLVNESGSWDTTGVVLRVASDGSQTLVQTLNGAAKSDMSMRRYPFDRQRLEAVFEVLGFDHTEVRLEANSATAGSIDPDVWIPQWTVVSISCSTRDRRASYAGPLGVASSFVVHIDVKRRPFFIVRLVVIPLAVIVGLSFSVFWMDRSTLGDRISVSFIGILTAVAYQMVLGDIMPRIAYFTLMNGFLNISFFTMCATVVINLVVGAFDQCGKPAIGDRIDFRCRWFFPLCYCGLIMIASAVAFAFF